MNKKGNIAIIGGVILLILTIITITAVVVPIVKTTNTAQTTSEDIIYVNQSLNQTQILTNTDMESASLSITGLVLNTNYTIDYDTANLTFLDGTNADTYSVVYSYYDANYQTSATSRTLFGLLIVVLIFGLVYVGAKTFGVLD